MTRERDIERILDHWMAEGPAEAPDRVLDVMADQIGRQRQRSAWESSGVRTRISPSARLVAIAAALATVVLGWSVVVGGGGRSAPTLTATPSAVPADLSGPSDALAAGTYAYTANGGRTTFTVPDGWSAPTRGDLDFALAPVGAAEGDAIRVFYDMRVASRDAACPEAPEPGIGSSAEAIVGNLVEHPGLIASAPAPASTGGLDGLAIDLELAPGYEGTCPFGDGVPSIPLIVDTVPGEGPFWGVERGDRMRLIVLDHPAATNVVIVISAISPAALEELAAAATPVLDTFRFE